MRQSQAIEVAAAVIEDDRGRILIARRKPGKSQAGLWEFPGGKLEAGESVTDCIRRELQEEMNITVEVGERLGINEFAYDTVRIRLIAHFARYTGGGAGELALTDHDAFEWVERGELRQYVFAPADVKFVEMLAGE